MTAGSPNSNKTGNNTVSKPNIIIYNIFSENGKKNLSNCLEDMNFIPLREKVSELMLYNDHYIVKYNVFELDNIQGYERYRNIWCFSKDGDLLWRIQGTKTQKPFSTVSYDKEQAELKTVSGSLIFDIDIETGAISNPEQTK